MYYLTIQVSKYLLNYRIVDVNTTFDYSSAILQVYSNSTLYVQINPLYFYCIFHHSSPNNLFIIQNHKTITAPPINTNEYKITLGINNNLFCQVSNIKYFLVFLLIIIFYSICNSFIKPEFNYSRMSKRVLRCYLIILNINTFTNPIFFSFFG